MAKKKKAEFNKDDFTAEVNKHLGRLFHNQGVLSDGEDKPRIDKAVDFYVSKMGEVSSPTQISSIIYSEYAINNYRGSVTKGISALWNSVYAAYKGFAAHPIAIVMGLVTLAFTLVSFAVLAASVLAFVLVAAGGAFYIFVGFTGFSENAATALAFAGIGLMAFGIVFVFLSISKRFFVTGARLISVPIFALSICVRQYARSKRIKHLT